MPSRPTSHTAEGAESIDAIAAEARAVPQAGARVVGHFDWRVESVRFEGGSMVAMYDWDSLHLDLEPVVVGWASRAFCANWSDDSAPAAPTVDEIRAFVAGYEAARGRSFEGDERRTFAVAVVYGVRYTARCAHALGVDAPERALALRELLEREGRRLLQII